MNKYLLVLSCLCILCLTQSCKDDEMLKNGDLEDISYSPTPYQLIIPDSFPPMAIPADNPMTQEGVDLGHHLFFDNILSADETQSCSSCHNAAGAFTDNLAVSVGIDGIAGTRSSMSLMNIGFVNGGLFWDGRSPTLEAQALLPVEDPIELHNTWTNVINKLKAHDDYPTKFRKAFGITDRSEITSDLAAKAIAQYERALVVGGNSRFDLFLTDDEDLTDQETRGHDIYFDIPIEGVPDGQCFHCHNQPLFGSNQFFNNGLQEAASLSEFADLGRGGVTGKVFDNGKFRAPSLRNIELSAPYMHNGSLATLEDVVEFYANGTHFSDNLDVNVQEGIDLDEQDKADLVAFLKTLTDTSFETNPLFYTPF